MTDPHEASASLPAEPSRTVPDRPPIRRLAAAGLLAAGVGFGGAVAWAALAPLAGGAVLPGLVRVETNAKAIQHPDGGIIAELRVREGERVTAGQPLLRLDDVESRSLLALLEEQGDRRSAEEARLTAERDGLDGVRFPPELESRRDDPRLRDILNGQERIFTTRRDTLAGQVGMALQRIEQQHAQIRSLEAQIASGARQLAYIREEVAGVEELVRRGLERRPRLLALQRAAVALEGQQEDHAARIAALREETAAVRLQIESLKADHARQTVEELRQTQADLVETREKLATARVRHSRRELLAPQDGRVMNLRHFAAGAVVPAADPIMEVVPEGERLYVDARAPPAVIGSVREGLPARVVLLAYRQRAVPHLDARVLRVSADILHDERDGQPYYLVRVAIDADQLARRPEVALSPGMPVEVMVIAEERSMLGYLLQPVRDSFRRAFVE